MWTHFTSLSTPPKTHQRKPWRIDRGLSCLYGEFLCDALILKWVEAQVWRQCLHSVSHIVSEQQQQRWNSPWSSLSAASPSITDTVSLFLMVFGDFDRLLPGNGRGFWQELLYGQAVSPLRGVTQTVVRGPSGVSLRLAWRDDGWCVFPPLARVVFTVNERDWAPNLSHAQKKEVTMAQLPPTALMRWRWANLKGLFWTLTMTLNELFLTKFKAEKGEIKPFVFFPFNSLHATFRPTVHQS